MDWSRIRFFKKEEFACHCCGEVKMSERFIHKLDSARGDSGVPFKINSGYRCPKHDSSDEVKGSGIHPLGVAADIFCCSSNDRFLILNALMKNGFSRIGIRKDFIHVDISDERPDWLIWLY